MIAWIFAAKNAFYSSPYKTQFSSRFNTFLIRLVLENCVVPSIYIYISKPQFSFFLRVLEHKLESDFAGLHLFITYMCQYDKQLIRTMIWTAQSRTNCHHHYDNGIRELFQVRYFVVLLVISNKVRRLKSTTNTFSMLALLALPIFKWRFLHINAITSKFSAFSTWTLTKRTVNVVAVMSFRKWIVRYLPKIKLHFKT